MKKFLPILATATLIAAAHSEPLELAKQKNCLACHAVDTKILGPAFKDVAAKYAGQPGAADALTKKVLKGTVGTWGKIPMPPNTQVTPDEARQIVGWVLTQK